MIKRALDIAGASIGILLLGPVMAVLALLLYLTDGSPVLLRQLRPGLHQKPFELIKFRTMRQLNVAAGAGQTDAERLTPFGRWLRSTSLDELPELINVLRGDMSLVGPRPLLMEYLPLYSPRQARRHEVKPGITGWAQVNGRNAVSWEERLEHDVWYVENQSMLLDLKILVKTAAIVLSRKGINAPGEATMARFTGSKKATNSNG